MNAEHTIDEAARAGRATQIAAMVTTGIVAFVWVYFGRLYLIHDPGEWTQWVYAGLSIDLLLAFYSQLNGVGSIWDKFDPILVMAFVFASYVLRRCMRANRWSI